MPFFTEEKATVAPRIGLNIIAPKSATFTEEQKEAALGGVAMLKVLIVDVSDPDKVLMDEEIPACKFFQWKRGLQTSCFGFSV